MTPSSPHSSGCSSPVISSLMHEFLTDVRFIAATDVELGQLLAVAERVSGYKTQSPFKVHCSPVEMTEPEEEESQKTSKSGIFIVQ